MSDIPETSTEASFVPSADDALTMATNLARNCGWAVFPCSATKAPAIPGPGGYKHATKDPDEIKALWRRHPGPLVGVATGSVSGVWVVDIDSPRHIEAWQWWQDHHPRLSTRVFQTRSGGLHLYFRDGQGIGNTAGRICRGIDTRGDGGYVIFWFAAGLECLNESPIAPFPDWLRLLTMPPPAPARTVWKASGSSGEGGIAGILKRLSEAPEGERNNLLYWAARRLGEKGLGTPAVAAALLPVTASLGLSDLEARRTIESATKGGPS
jgi:hypothetical protein